MYMYAVSRSMPTSSAKIAYSVKGQHFHNVISYSQFYHVHTPTLTAILQFIWVGLRPIKNLQVKFLGLLKLQFHFTSHANPVLSEQ